MPLYEFFCDGFAVHRETRFMAMADYDPQPVCEEHGRLMERIFTPPILVTAAADVCYDSPMTGAPITSWAARTEDLKRNGCRPYDEGMRQDHERKLQESERVLEQSIEQDVERSIAQMPTAKRGKLYNELTRAGVDAVVTR